MQITPLNSRVDDMGYLHFLVVHDACGRVLERLAGKGYEGSSASCNEHFDDEWSEIFIRASIDMVNEALRDVREY